MPKLTLSAEVHRLVPKLFRAEVTRGEHRLPLSRTRYILDGCPQKPHFKAIQH